VLKPKCSKQYLTASCPVVSIVNYSFNTCKLVRIDMSCDLEFRSTPVENTRPQFITEQAVLGHQHVH
jgi:hypothetical protein